MSPYRPIDCGQHDYLELACMHHARLLLELNDDTAFEAEAVTTRTSHDKEEFLCVQDGRSGREIRLDELRAVTPLGENANLFERVQLAR